MISTSDVAVVILNWNGAPHLRTYLPSVVQHSDSAHVIVADNGSTDDSELVVAGFDDVDWLPLQRNYGFAEGYNQALARVQAKVYVLLNSDVRVTPRWLEAPLAKLNVDVRVAAVQPKVLADARPTHFEYAGAAGGFLDDMGYPYCRGRVFAEVEEDRGQYDDDAQIDWATGACLFVRSERYRELGGLDEHFFAHMEEIDFCWRLRRAGYTCWVTPASVVYHLGGGTLAYQSPHKTFLNFRNSLASIYGNVGGVRGVATLIARQGLDAVAAIKFLLAGQPKQSFAIARAHLAFYRWLPRLRRHKRTSQVLAKAVSSNGPSRSVVYDFYVRGRRTFTQLRRGRE